MRSHSPSAPFRVCLWTVAAAALALPAWGEPPLPDGVREVLRKAEALVEDGEYGQAARAFEQADEMVPGPCGECLLGVGRAYIGSGDARAALQVTRMALPLLDSPALLARAQHQVGAALARSGGDLEAAEAALKKAVELDPSREPKVRPDLADLLVRKGETAAAVALARQSLAEAPQGRASAAMRSILCRAKATGETVVGRAGERVFRPGRDAVQPPVELVAPQPEQHAAGGTVLVRAVVDRDGCVQEVRVVESVQEDLDRAAVDAVKRWTFQPATHQGQPVSADTTLAVSFDGARSLR